jgi:phosphoribosylformylglycinamidine cyclo-ligase
MPKLTYRDSGVDLETYQESMARLPKLLQQTHCPRVIPWNNGFAGLFQLDFTDSLFSRNYRHPVLVSCTDGVGTKLLVAQMARSPEPGADADRSQSGAEGGQLYQGKELGPASVGIDLVAMCVNDAICCGAEPLFFLDYIAMAEDDPPLLEQLVTGIRDGCLQADTALVGGETAIMPDMYQPGDYDMGGFCVGIVERSRLLDGSAITPGDTILGIASSGLHSNGYSLVRKIVFEHGGLLLDQVVASCNQTVGELLLEPTRIYVRAIRAVLNHYKVKNVVHGIAHITGGGLCENLSRILPCEVDAVLQPGSWPIPPVFSWLQELGEIDDAEMNRVFNMGIGLTLVVSEFFANHIRQQLASHGMESWVLGSVSEGSGEARWE